MNPDNRTFVEDHFETRGHKKYAINVSDKKRIENNMMTANELYRFFSFILPLYVFMFMGYCSAKWWKLFNQEQCTGISRFCLFFAVPVLSFHYITKTNLYEMDLKLLGADILQKMIVIVILACWYKLDPRGSIERFITIFSICTLPNTLILGVPIIKSMYLASAAPLIVEIFLGQSIIWHPLLLIMYEYRVARIANYQQFGDTHGRDVDTETTTTGEHGVAGRISSTNTKGEEVEATSVATVGGGDGVDSEILIHPEGHGSSRDQSFVGNEQEKIDEVPSASTTKIIPTSMSSTSVITKQIVINVWKKLISNPNTYATTLGLLWAFVLSEFQIVMPPIVTGPFTFLSNASLGMGMFNMGLSMGLQQTFIPCGKVVVTLTMVLRFIIGPIVMAFASLVVGIRGIMFHIAVVQAAVSQGVAPSVFAIQYNVYPEIFSIGMISGMVVALPVTVFYYNFLEILA